MYDRMSPLGGLLYARTASREPGLVPVIPFVYYAATRPAIEYLFTIPRPLQCKSSVCCGSPQSAFVRRCCRIRIQQGKNEGFASPGAD